MSRSVSYASGSVWVQYLRPSREGETDRDFGEMQESWDDFVANLEALFISSFHSLNRCDQWLGREDHAVLENQLAYIGISEYCGLVSLWCVPKDPATNLANQWCSRIEKKVQALLLKNFPGQCLISQGRFSNGEQCFALADEPGSCVTSKEGRLW